MKDELRNALKDLSHSKYEAFKLGRKKAEVSELRTIIATTDYPSGDVAEIVMAYMLGRFSKLVKGVYINMNSYLDMKGIDFLITRFGFEYKIQMKFNRHNDKDYAEDITVVELGASRKFMGTKYLDEMRGCDAVLTLLESSGVYDEEELYDFFDDNEEFAELCKRAWEIIAN